MLEFQHIPIEITGLDTKTDPNKLQPGSLISMTNCYMAKTGRLSPREGYDVASNALAQVMVQGMDGEQSVFIGDQGTPYVLLSSGGSQAQTTNYAVMNSLLADVLASIPGATSSGSWVVGKSQFACGQSVACGFSNAVAGQTMTMYAWNSSSRSVSSIRTVTVASGLAAATVDREFSAIVGRMVFSPSAGVWQWINVQPGATLVTTGTYSSISYLGTDANDRMDTTYIRTINGIGYHGTCWYDHGTTTVRMAIVSEFGTQNTFNLATGAAINSLSVTRTYDNKFLVTLGKAANSDIVVVDETGATVESDTLVGIAGPLHTATASASEYIVLKQSGSTAIRYNIQRVSLAVVTTNHLYMECNSSAECDDSGSYYYVLRSYPEATGLSLTSYVFYKNGIYNGTFLGDSATGLNYNVPPELSVSDSRISVPLFKITQANTVLGEAAFDVIGMQFDRNTAEELIKSTYINWNGTYLTSAYGVLMGVDLRPLAQGSGVNLAASPFPLSLPTPLKPSVASVAGAGIAAGTYNFVTVYEFQDFNGNTMWSAPSQITQLVVGAPVGSFDITVPQPPYSGVRITVYRTVANGTVFYKVLEKTSSGTYNTAVTDANLIASQPLYTTGGILESSPIPAVRSISYAKNRAWIVSAENDSLVYFSNELRSRELPRFNEAFVLHVNTTGGKLVAVSELDDKIIIFRESAIYLSYGNGPDETGAGNFQEPILIHSSRGCTNPRIIVNSDDGLMFLSKEGIQLLTKSLQVVNIGAPVEDFNSLKFCGVHNRLDKELIQFYSVDGTTLNFDTFHKLWSSFSQPATYATSMSSVTNLVYLGVISNKKILRTLPTIATDDGANFTVSFKTGMISFSSIQGFQRVRNMTFVGNNVNTATIKTYVDYNSSTIVDTFTTNVSGQWQHKPSRQRTEAIAFEYSVTGSTTWYISSVSFEVGAKRGTYKFDRSKRS